MSKDIKNVLDLIEETSGQAPEDNGWFTIRDLMKESGYSKGRALSTIRGLIEDGTVEGGGRVMRVNIANIPMSAPAYRIKRKGK